VCGGLSRLGGREAGELGARNGERRTGRTCGELSSKNGEGGAVNHRHCLAPTWKEKKMRSVGFMWGYTCCITLGYLMDLETKMLLE